MMSVTCTGRQSHAIAKNVANGDTPKTKKLRTQSPTQEIECGESPPPLREGAVPPPWNAVPSALRDNTVPARTSHANWVSCLAILHPAMAAAVKEATDARNAAVERTNKALNSGIAVAAAIAAEKAAEKAEIAATKAAIKASESDSAIAAVESDTEIADVAAAASPPAR